jgi:hypothetical protein
MIIVLSNKSKKSIHFLQVHSVKFWSINKSVVITSTHGDVLGTDNQAVVDRIGNARPGEYVELSTEEFGNVKLVDPAANKCL